MIEMKDLLAKSLREFKEGSIVKGRILEIRPREVLVDIGYKSEGAISKGEFDDASRFHFAYFDGGTYIFGPNETILRLNQ